MPHTSANVFFLQQQFLIRKGLKIDKQTYCIKTKTAVWWCVRHTQLFPKAERLPSLTHPKLYPKPRQSKNNSFMPVKFIHHDNRLFLQCTFPSECTVKNKTDVIIGRDEKHAHTDSICDLDFQVQN